MENNVEMKKPIINLVPDTCALQRWKCPSVACQELAAMNVIDQLEHTWSWLEQRWSNRWVWFGDSNTWLKFNERQRGLFKHCHRCQRRRYVKCKKVGMSLLILRHVDKSILTYPKNTRQFSNHKASKIDDLIWLI